MPDFKCPEGHETSAPKQPARCPYYHLGSPCGREITQFGKGAKKAREVKS